MKKLGLDIHGVIDKDPEFFRMLSVMATDKCHEVHVITGPMISEKLEQELNDYGILYTHIFSITGHHISIGTEIFWKDSDNPFFDKYLWNSTKGIYCKEYNMTLHVDDSPEYEEHFETPFIFYRPGEEEHWKNHLIKTVSNW